MSEKLVEMNPERSIIKVTISTPTAYKPDDVEDILIFDSMPTKQQLYDNVVTFCPLYKGESKSAEYYRAVLAQLLFEKPCSFYGLVGIKYEPSTILYGRDDVIYYTDSFYKHNRRTIKLWRNLAWLMMIIAIGALTGILILLMEK